MVNTFGPNGFSSGSSTRVSRSKVSQIIIHKADQPDVFVNFFDADGLTGEDRLKLIFLCPRQMRPQWVTTMVLVVEGIVDVGQSGIGNGWKADRPQPDTSCPRLHEDVRC